MNYYTNEKNTLILISLLKKYNIKRIIVSPGATNVSFVASCQYDGFFEMYSAFDERSAAFMAYGMAMNSGEPVVLSCTGATASRNYIPGLTKAYYDKAPVIAITSTLNTAKIGHHIPQLIDRTQQFVDLVHNSYQLRSIFSKEDENMAITNLNYFLHEVVDNKSGPCHINLMTNYSYNFSIKTLPECKKIMFYNSSDSLPEIKLSKIGIFVGNHEPFSEDLTKVIDDFCSIYDCVVLCDKTSNYHGKYEFQASLSNSQEKVLSSRFFDLIIHIGSISGAYLVFSAKEVWRVNPDGKYRDTFGRLSSVFMMEEKDFFGWYSKNSPNAQHKDSLLNKCFAERASLLNKIGDLPFSNIAIAKTLAPMIPNNSVLNLGILNSLRAWNFFDLDNSVFINCNTGGFGIDGCLSSAIGYATEEPNRDHFIILGDLAFFYDINSLLQSSPNNLHILVVNNGIGCEFKNYNHRAALFGEKTDLFIAARGHNGCKSKTIINDFALDNSISYFCASNMSEFKAAVDDWLKCRNLCIMEVFTCDKDESEALRIMNTLYKDSKVRIKKRIKSIVKKVLRK